MFIVVFHFQSSEYEYHQECFRFCLYDDDKDDDDTINYSKHDADNDDDD